MKKVVAIIQARLGSSRLPGKVLMDIAGRPALGHVIVRLQAARRIQQICVATTTKEEDRAILDLAREYGVAVFAGRVNDVLDRYYQAARKFNADVVVRVTADCPLMDPRVVDQVIEAFLDADGKYDHVSTDDSFPDGLDTAVFSFSALAEAWSNARLLSEREHVTPYIYNNPDKFRLATITYPNDLHHLRWTLDEPEDLLLIRKIYEYARHQRMGILYMQDVLKILEAHPELNQINSHVIRNEGYLKSLENDFVIEK
jgi:spore coat polysaccharide biosynthesis protein SpsF (cytidylyltransferase family)